MKTLLVTEEFELRVEETLGSVYIYEIDIPHKTVNCIRVPKSIRNELSEILKVR